MHYLGTGGARAAVVRAAEAVFVHMLAERTAVLPGYRPTGRASSTCASSRRCARSLPICAGSACWWSMAMPTLTLAVGPASVRAHAESA